MFIAFNYFLIYLKNFRNKDGKYVYNQIACENGKSSIQINLNCIQCFLKYFCVPLKTLYIHDLFIKKYFSFLHWKRVCTSKADEQHRWERQKWGKLQEFSDMQYFPLYRWHTSNIPNPHVYTSLFPSHNFLSAMILNSFNDETMLRSTKYFPKIHQSTDVKRKTQHKVQHSTILYLHECIWFWLITTAIYC